MSPLTSLASGKARSHFRLGKEKYRNSQKLDKQKKDIVEKRERDGHTKDKVEEIERMTRERERERKNDEKERERES